MKYPGFGGSVRIKAFLIGNRRTLPARTRVLLNTQGSVSDQVIKCTTSASRDQDNSLAIIVAGQTRMSQHFKVDDVLHRLYKNLVRGRTRPGPDFFAKMAQNVLQRFLQAKKTIFENPNRLFVSL